ncbi:MAG: hypothetical protein K5695_00240 [Oscillospiraceae bacterium]|nr:hypothetical protein [Oscillospiraceae bacterium]
MENTKRIATIVLLLAGAAIFWVCPDPIPVVDEIGATLFTLIGIGNQLRGIEMNKKKSK